MHRFLLHNDEIRDAGDRIVSPGQVGLLNGWGVFSTIRIYDGVMFAWERHWARMQRDAIRMRVPFPEGPDLARRTPEAIDRRESSLQRYAARGCGAKSRRNVGRSRGDARFRRDRFHRGGEPMGRDGAIGPGAEREARSVRIRGHQISVLVGKPDLV